jgi:hypothetical protein
VDKCPCLVILEEFATIRLGTSTTEERQMNTSERPNLMNAHPDDDVRNAMIRLSDALCRYERSTGREYLLIVKGDTSKGPMEYRSLSGGPASQDADDEHLLESFEGTIKPPSR